MTIIEQFWDITPAGNGTQYSGYPLGNPPEPTWVRIPNFVNETAAVDVDILTEYVTPASGPTLTLNGTLPAGWTFNGTNLIYDGVTVNAVPTTGLSFTANYNAFSINSNTFSVQGSGAAVPENPYPPTTPLGVGVTSITQTGFTVFGLPVSQPSQTAYQWKGLGQYNVTIPGAPGSPFAVSAGGAGYQPILTFADIGSPPTPSNYSQVGSSITITTVAEDPSYPTTDGIATGFAQVTGTSWVLSCQVSTFGTSNEYSNVGLQARATMADNSSYVSMLTCPFSQGHGFVSEYRATAGGNATQVQQANNTTGPVWLFLVRNGDTYSYYYSLNGNTLIAMGTQTQVMGSTIYVGVIANSSDGTTVGPVTLQEVNLQTLPGWTLSVTGLTPGDSYPITVTAQNTQAPPIVSAPSTSVTATTTAAGTSPANDPFPRMAGLFYNQQSNYNQSAFQTIAAKTNIPIMLSYLGLEGSLGFTIASAMAAIISQGSANGITVRPALYINNQALATAPNNGGDYSTFANWINTVNAQDWWLRSSYPGGGIVSDPFDTSSPSGSLQNSININGNTVGGRNFFQYFAWYFWNVDTQGTGGSLFGESGAPAPNPSLKMFFIDNRWWVPRATGAWAENGTSYNPGSSSSTLYPWQQQGHQAQVNALRALFNGLIIGNCDFFNGYPQVPSVIDPSNVGLYDVVFSEEVIGQSYSKETYAGGITALQALTASEPMIRSGGTLVVHQDGRTGGNAWSSTSQSGWSTLDFAAARNGAAMAFMRNYHWACGTANYSAAQMLYFDEMEQGGKIGWMGPPIDPPQTAAWQNNVWRRRYTKGWWLWLPRGAGTQTVSLGTPMNACSSLDGSLYGDPSINNGATGITSLTLQDNGCGNGQALIVP